MARICVIRQFYLPADPRVGRELDALTTAGHTTDVICLRQPGEPAARQRDGSLTIHRLPITHRRGGIARYLFEYVAFPLMAAVYLAWLDRRRRFELVQVNTLPDWLVFAALVPRLRRVPVLLDLQEITPEFFQSKFGKGPGHPGIRALALLEQASIRFASRALTCTEQMREAFVSRGAAPDRIAVVMNSAQESIFDPERYPPRAREEGRFSLISHGTIEERYGIDTIIRAVARLRDRIPGLTLDIFGSGSTEEDCRRLVAQLSLEDVVAFHGWVPIEQLLAAIAGADAGVVAMKRDAFRDLTHCNKMFDLITMRRPVICSRTKAAMVSFSPECLHYFDGDDDADLARAIVDLYENPGLADQLVENAAAANESYRWPYQRERYLTVVDELLAGQRPGPRRPERLQPTIQGGIAIMRQLARDAAQSTIAAALRLCAPAIRVLGRRATQYHADPRRYTADVSANVPNYREMQSALARATLGIAVSTALDLGSGTGVTAAAVLAVHPAAQITAIDASAEMLDVAREQLPSTNVARLVVGRLQDPLPASRFDVVVSALAVHHLSARQKRALFARVHDALVPGGRFVLADVVRTERAARRTPVSRLDDRLERAEDLERWLAQTGFNVSREWASGDLLVLRADRAGERAGGEGESIEQDLLRERGGGRDPVAHV